MDRCWIGFFGTLLTASTLLSGPVDDPARLRAIGVGDDDASLLNFLKRSSPPDATPEELTALVAQLGSPKFSEREAASRRLGGNPMAAPFLRAGAGSGNPEIATRAKACLQQCAEMRSREACAALAAAFFIGVATAASAKRPSFRRRSRSSCFCAARAVPATRARSTCCAAPSTA